MMDEPTLAEWLDRHHVGIVRTMAVLLDGSGIGEYVHRSQFEASLPLGGLSPDQAVYLAPDLNTLISDGTDANLGHVMCDLVTSIGNPSALCPRAALKRVIGETSQHDLSVDVSASLSFCLYAESFESLRAKHYRVDTTAPSVAPASDRLHRSYQASQFMNEVIKRLEWKHIGWQSWRNQQTSDQLALVLSATDPLALADNLVRTRIVMYEVAVDTGMAVTFMARPARQVRNTLNFCFRVNSREGKVPPPHPTPHPTPQWMAGLSATLPATICLSRPGGNAFRLEPGERTALTLKQVAGAEPSGHIAFDGCSANLNPYLVLAAMLASGLTGIEARLPDVTDTSAPPLDMTTALSSLAENRLLTERLGASIVDAWLELQKEELRLFRAETSAEASAEISAWELIREFERF